MGEVILDLSLRDDLNTEFKLTNVLNADKASVAQLIEHPLLHLQYARSVPGALVRLAVYRWSARQNPGPAACRVGYVQPVAVKSTHHR